MSLKECWEEGDLLDKSMFIVACCFPFIVLFLLLTTIVGFVEVL